MNIRVEKGHDRFTAPWPIFCPAWTINIFHEYLSFLLFILNTLLFSQNKTLKNS